MTKTGRKKSAARRAAVIANRLQALGQETYLDSVAREMVGRVGRGAHQKGTAHEIIFRDKQNTSASALLRGERTRLAPNTNGKMLDVYTTGRDGKIIRRYQLKDAVSGGGIHKIVKQGASGKYKYAKLVGTKETKKLYDQASSKMPKKPMSSSGVSSETTTRVADNAGAKVPNKALLLNNLRDVGRQAASAGAFAAATSAAAEAVSSFGRMRRGEIGKAEYTGRVVTAGVQGGAASGARTAAALGMKEAGKAVGKKVGSQALRRFAGSNAGTAVAFTAVEQILDTAKVLSGKMSGSEYGVKSCQNVGGGGGAFGGALAGASLGSVVPIVGTAIGGLIGGVVGGLGGGWFGKAFGKFCFG